jgi:hypothetical protein
LRPFLKFMLLVFPALSLTAFSQVTFTSPLTASTVTDQVRVTGTAVPSTAGHWISKLTIYVDSKSVFNGTSGNFSALVSVSTGKHTILVKAWDNKGIGCQAATYITASGSGSGFYIASPQPGTTVNNPVPFSVNVTSVTSKPLASTTLYVDGAAVYRTAASILSTTAAVTAGKHAILIESVDTAAAKNDLNFTINANAPTQPPPPPPLQITTSATLPNDTVGVTYSQTLGATGGSGTKVWSITAGALPSGLALQSNGTIGGASNATPGQFSFTATVADISGSASQQFVVSVVGGVTSGAIPITDCNTPLAISNQLYQLANDISSSGTCLSVQGHDITIDLNGHTITYGTAATNPAGQHRHGILAIACWDNETQGNPCSDSANFANITVAGNLGNPTVKGKIVQGSAAAAYSHAIRVGQGSVVNGLTVQGVDITISAPSSIAVYTNFSTGGAAIYNNTIHNNVTQILNRMNLEGQSIKLDNESHATVGNMIHENTIIGGAQGGIRETNQAGSKLYNNDISLNASYTNDFCIDAIGVNVEIYGNNCHNTQGRGFHLAGDKLNVHDNTINVVEHSNNLEYGGAISSISRSGNVITVNTSSDLYRSAGDTMWIAGTAGLDGHYSIASVVSPHSYTINSAGTDLSLGSGGTASSCEIGGSYGIQIESDLMPSGTINVNNNKVTANADECPASGLRLTSVVSSSTLNIHDNVFIANRVGSTTQPASGVSVDQVDLSGTTIANNAFSADSALLRLEYDGAQNVAIKGGIVTTASNPASPWLLADFQNYSGGLPAQNLVVLDPTYQGSATDQNMHIVRSNIPQELYENWTLALKLVDTLNNPVSGASVSIKDSTGTVVYTGTSDSNGLVQTIVTQKHWLNTGTVSNTPHTVTVNDSKCSAGTGSFNVTVNSGTLPTPGTPFVHSMGTCQ